MDPGAYAVAGQYPGLVTLLMSRRQIGAKLTEGHDEKQHCPEAGGGGNLFQAETMNDLRHLRREPRELDTLR